MAIDSVSAQDERAQEEAPRGQEDWLGSVHAILWRADPHTFQTTFVSREVEDILGYPAECWVNTPGFWRDHIHPEDRERVERFTAEATREGRKHDFEYRMVVADGKVVWVRNIVNVRIQNGKPVELVGVTVDISERKRAEFETAQLRHELAHALRVTSVGELAAALAHELNQPLGAIVSNAEAAHLFLKRNPPAVDRLEAILQDIAADGERAAAVLRRIRRLLRKQEIEPQPLDVCRLVADVVASIRPLAGSKRIDVSMELEPDLPAPSGDPVQIQQVLLNLIVNAMDAVADAPDGLRTVTVRAGRAPDGIELSVEDTGKGIPPEVLPRMFEPFFTTKATGMGMGLAICQTIVNAHRGDIRVDGTRGRGAKVSFTLPASERPGDS